MIEEELKRHEIKKDNKTLTRLLLRCSLRVRAAK